MKNTNIKVLFFFLGIFLFGLNLYGLFVPLRNNDIYFEKQTYFKNDITLTEKKLLELLKRDNESDEEYLIKVNNAVNSGIAHYWKDEGINKYNFRIPIYENYLLFAASYLSPSKFKKYEYANYRKAIERGVGLCSQHALVLSQIIENEGIEAKVINISRHVVVTAPISKNKDIWWVLDPDFGVIIKNDIETIVQSPEIIRPYYFNKGYDTITVNTLTDSYSEIAGVYNGAFEYSGWKRYYFEKFTYIAIWVIPIFLIGIPLFSWKKQKS
jgi:hypothetical protein